MWCCFYLHVKRYKAPGVYEIAGGVTIFSASPQNFLSPTRKKSNIDRVPTVSDFSRFPSLGCQWDKGCVGAVMKNYLLMGHSGGPGCDPWKMLEKVDTIRRIFAIF